MTLSCLLLAEIRAVWLFNLAYFWPVADMAQIRLHRAQRESIWFMFILALKGWDLDTQINWWWPVDIMWCKKIWVKIGLGNGLVLDVTKPLFNPMMIYHGWNALPVNHKQLIWITWTSMFAVWERLLNLNAHPVNHKNVFKNIILKFKIFLAGTIQWFNESNHGIFAIKLLLCYEKLLPV